MKKKDWWKILGICIATTCVFWGLAALASNRLSLIITDKDIILTFVGILATFVVISNYAQVQEIKNEFENKIKDIGPASEKNIEDYLKLKNLSEGRFNLTEEELKMYINLNEQYIMIWPAITHRIKINFKESLERYSTDGGSLHLSQDTYIPILNDIIKKKQN
ncbi:MAG: hypothetical protein WCU80_06895 [Paludibacteraceae bacterium]